MARIVGSEFVTLDGVFEANETWQFPYYSDDLALVNQELVLGLDSLLLGRRTYDIFASSWPNRQDNEFGIAAHLNRIPKYLVSSSPFESTWHPTTIISEDLISTVKRLKDETTGLIGITGSGLLVNQLLEASLVDELLLFIHPLLRGFGRKLFERSIALSLALKEVRKFASGVVMLSYQRT